MKTAAAGCADRHTPQWQGGTAAEERGVQLNVTSDHFNDVVVYAGRSGSWRRIGMVTGVGTARLEVPRGLGTMQGEFRLRVHAIGASDRTDYVTELIRVWSLSQSGQIFFLPFFSSP